MDRRSPNLDGEDTQAGSGTRGCDCQGGKTYCALSAIVGCGAIPWSTVVAANGRAFWLLLVSQSDFILDFDAACDEARIDAYSLCNVPQLEG